MKFLTIIIALFSTCHCKVEFSDRARNFSIELLYFTAEETDWHTVISPFGVWSLLAGVSIGATDSSLTEINRVLILPKNGQTLINGYKSLTKDVLRAGTPGVALRSKNYLFADFDLEIKSQFRQNIRKNFEATLTRFNFDLPAEAARKANKLIQRSGITDSNVLKSDDFENSKMILTNVISFKGFWQLPFNVSDTTVQPFYDENINKIGEVNMMYLQANLAYSNINKLQAKVLELPYGDDDSKYSFLVLLPFAGIRVADVYRGLARVSLREIIEQLETDTEDFGLADVLVSLPRFKISTNVILNKPLKHMGLYDIFDPNRASFKSITEANNIFVSAIIHKADIEVTEIGTVASAFTSAQFADRIAPSSFNANRPFIYFVIEKTTTTIIFSGIYSKPSLF